MAHHNKSQPVRLSTRMHIQTFVLCFLWCQTIVQSTITSFNDKYANKQTLQSVKLDRGVLEFDAGRYSSSNSNNRIRRDADGVHNKRSGAAGASTDESDITVIRTVLNGTERSTKAFIHWMTASESIFVLTCQLNFSQRSWIQESQVWRSTDYGTSFQRKDSIFGTGVQISYFFPFTANGKKLLFTDIIAKKVYITEDELTTITSYDVPVEPDFIYPHPSDENKMLLYSATQRKLFVSTNNGANFTLLMEDVLPNFYWADTPFDSDKDIVHMEVEGGMPSQALYMSCKVPDCRKAQPNSLGPFEAGTLVVHKEYMLAQKTSLDGSDSYLAVSYNRGPFLRAHFPGNEKTNDFMLLNLDDGQIFIAVNHGDHVNLYLSEATGQYFVLSMSNIYHVMAPQSFLIDFHEVQGMNWTFIANKRETNGVKTYISFDKGGNWAPMKVRQNCTQGEQCSLLLDVQEVSTLVPMISEENAPGIIIAHGTIGTNFSAHQRTVFTSNDGGGNWIKATLPDGTPLTGLFRFNILDQGSILTAVPDGLLTKSRNNTLYYSCDEGLHWKQHQFHNEGLVVKGVLTEPGILTLVESVFGHIGDNKPWTILKVNFTKVLTKMCKEEDYTNWYPKDYNNPNSSSPCILGQVVSYKHRNNYQCYNGEKLAHLAENITCSCIPEDYECDFGYEEIKGDCVKAKWFNDSYMPAECDDGGTYMKSQGYRKIPADTCIDDGTGDSKYKRKKYDCQSAAPTGLFIVTESKNLEAGKEVTFHLEQAGGSKFDTTYTWNFVDGTPSKPVVGFKNASSQTHIFQKSGHYTVTVTAINPKGQTTASVPIHVQDPVGNVHLIGPTGGKVGMPVKFYVVVASHVALVPVDSDHVHFVWSFGDEKVGTLPSLTWENSITHVFNKSGTYTVTVEAVNSVSSMYEEYPIQIFDKVEILKLTLGNSIASDSLERPEIVEMLMYRIKQQVAEDVGVSFSRLESILVSVKPAVVHLFIFTSSDSGEPNVTFIRDTVINQVKKGGISVILYERAEHSPVLTIESAEELPDTDGGGSSSGPNMKAVYIAAPILVIIVIVALVSFLYCRKKMRNLRQYNILHAQDDSDALLDDDDVAPLDLNADFGIRESSRDDPMLDSGGSHLVMVTGGGSSDNAENC